MIGERAALLETEQGSLITIIGFPLIIYHSPLPHTYVLSSLHRPPESYPESYRPVTSAPTHLSSLHRPPESYRPVTSAPTHYYKPYSHIIIIRIHKRSVTSHK